MNKDISHGSIEELQAIDARKELDLMPPQTRKALRHHILQKMEEYDPGGKKAHEIAKRYYKKEGTNG